MRLKHFNNAIQTAVFAVAILLFGAGRSFAQQQINLTAGASSVPLPDGSSAPMWGYTCGATVSGSTATCAALNSNAGSGWSPVVITVPYNSTSTSLTINLTNNLHFAGTDSNNQPYSNDVPTSLVIVGQVGGGLGSQRTTVASPDHSAAQANATWPIVGGPSGVAPPPQGPRVQSLATEVTVGATSTALTWSNLRPGTYLLESGTHPSIQGPMGLYGMLVVTQAPNGATPGQTYGLPYNAEVPLLFSEIDPVHNNAVNSAVSTSGFSETAVLGVHFDTSTGVLSGIAVTNGGQNYTSVPTVLIAAPPAGGTQATAHAVIDTNPVSQSYRQVTEVDLDNPGSGYTSLPKVSFTGGGGTAATAVAGLPQGSNYSKCSGGATACYPAAVNYTPQYFLINGVAFNKTNAGGSLFNAVAGVDANNLPITTGIPANGSVLVRLVNAGLRMHVPSIVGAQTGATVAPATQPPAGFSLIAEDGNKLPGIQRVQSEVFMAAGKTYDVMLNVPGTGAGALPIFDRQLSLSAAATRDGGMLAYIGVNGSQPPLSAAALGAAVVRPDTYNSVIAGKGLNVSDVAIGVIANDTNVYGVSLSSNPSHGTVILNTNGTFTYTPNADWASATPVTSDSFTYHATNAPASVATVTLSAAPMETAANISCGSSEYWSNLSTSLTVKNPGVLENCKSAAGYPLTVDTAAGKITQSSGLTVSVDKGGSFVASTTAPGNYTFTFYAQNSQGTDAASPATVTLHFPQPGKLKVVVFDGADKTTQITDYRWVIEEDRTFYVDPACTKNPQPAGCPSTSDGKPIIFGTNFHSSHMPLIAAGCTGPLSCESGQTQLGANVVCDVANGLCRPGTSQTPVDPSQIGLCNSSNPDPDRRCLDPKKRYYISVLPGDAANPFIGGNASAPSNCKQGPYNADGSLNTACGHGMGGAPVTPVQVASNGAQQITVLTQPSPYPPGKLSVFVFEDDNPLNGEHDAGGGLDILAPNEPGLGGFELTIFDAAGGTGDATGQPTYDMFNMPLTNSLAGTIDPMTGADACPISPGVTDNATQTGANATPAQCAVNPQAKGCQKGIVGMILTCPTYESDGVTMSPLAGQAVINNLYQGRYTVVATPAADRIARGEEWLQTNTLDGQKALDAFIRIGEPAYFQEFGPAGYHVTIGFANPKIINGRAASVCQNADCSHTVSGVVTMGRMTRVPDERTYGSGNRDAYSFTQCYISLGDPDGEDFAFTKCHDDGTFELTGIPSGNWKVTFFDQWNDQIVDGIQVPVAVNGQDVNMGEIAAHQWQTNMYTSTYMDLNGNGIHDDGEPGLPLVATNVRFRDGSFSNFNSTDLEGNAGFNEIFPLFNWYVVETDYSRYKNSGTHVVYDAGGPVDINGAANPNPNGQATCGLPGVPQCANSQIAANIARTYEAIPLPAALSVPGAVYCAGADCTTESATYHAGYADTAHSDPNTTHSTGRIDPPWVQSEAWQGFIGQAEFIEFGKLPFVQGENGGIRGHVVYASTRPFDDPQMLLQLSWEPLIPHVKINLYAKGTAPDGTTSLHLVDTTETSSFDDWAQGYRRDAAGNFVKDASGNYIPNMNCPGQTSDDPFYYSLLNQPSYLDWYDSAFNGGTLHPMSSGSQFKCYDGMHNWNQVQPAPYDGMYQFPSTITVNHLTGKPASTNCHMANSTENWGCIPNPDTDKHWAGLPMLMPGRYVVEVVVPPGYELVKEEDKNILIGDNFIAPVTQQFGGLSNIFILPDQATVENTYNAQNPTQTLGRDNSQPTHESDTGSDESYWPCVGTLRTVPDYISLFPGSAEVAPFAGATRPLCDRKEVTLESGMSAQTKFYLFTSTHVASHFTGQITDDFTSEFNPFSPAFGEKFAPSYMPVGVRDWQGNLTQTVYSDQFGAYNGMSYSTWEVNPPNPTGYGPTMMVMCMNDALMDNGAAADVHFQPGYSQFCYHLPFMPGQTGYFDTPVVGITAFAEGYNHPDCSYPDATPAIKSVVSSDIAGPWVSTSGTGHTLTITTLGDQLVENYGYTGPSATVSPFNNQKVTRHYGFGSCSLSSSTHLCTNGASVTIGGVQAPIQSWTDSSITVTAPSGVPTCPGPQQQAQYGGTPLPAQCGELLITTSSGKKSVDAVTVTIGGKKPVAVINGENAANNAIQSAIDTAAPGDMIIVGPGTYNEMVLMWKPVRLQGVGAESSIINANTHPAGKLDPWRRQVACLFGIALDGSARLSSSTPFDPSGTFSCPGNMTYLPDKTANWPTLIVDRIPMEGVLGWDTSVNGNLAEQLIEPSIMGAYEGAAISVLAKGVNISTTGGDPFGSGANESAFPAGSLPLMGGATGNGAGIYNARFGDANPSCHISSSNTTNPYPSNYMCNPSMIDGLGIQNSSQGGGGIFVHAWAHNLQIANNRVRNNTGTLAGGITIGQGEHTEIPVSPTVGNAGTLAVNVPPASCLNSGDPNALALPYCYNLNVNVHNNSVTLNSSIGDELFTSTPAGPGGVAFSNGADYYNFQSNWVCGNLSSGDGAGVAHIGYSYFGTIQSNTIIFNQSTNPTIPTNGGGLLVMGAPDPNPLCGSVNDKDCVSPPGSIAPGDGAGPGLLINGNIIMGNSADSGSGGGIRLQHINGTDVLSHMNGNSGTSWPGLPSDGSHNFQSSSPWNKVRITNNIIANNVAGWDGGGVSLLDALNVDFINNTIVSNDSTASSGALFSSLFAPLASSVGPCPVPVDPVTGQCPAGAGSTPQPGGLVSINNSAVLFANMQANGLTSFTCPNGHGGVVGATGTACRQFSAPVLQNNVIWQNRTFAIGIGALGPGLQNQQYVVKLKNGLSGTLAANQTATGQCLGGADYWDIGVRGDTGPTNHGSGLSLTPTFSILSSGGYTANSNLSANPELTNQYCNGSRIPPEACSGDMSSASCFANLGWQVPPGTNETNAWPVPQFSLSPSATVDEGNNWINLRWGPLAMANPITNTVLADFHLVQYSPAINAGTLGTGATTSPTTDIFGNPRVGGVDVGAVEFQGARSTSPNVYPTSLAFGDVNIGSNATLNTTVYNPTAGTVAIAVSGLPASGFTRVAGGCGANVTANNSCNITVQFAPTTTTPANTTMIVTVGGTAFPVQLTGTGVQNLFVTPTNVTFATTRVGGTSTSQTVTLTNQTTSAANGIALAFSNAQFSRSGGTCGTTLAVGASCTIITVFKPTTLGTQSGLLTITSSNLTVVGSPVSLSGISGGGTLSPTTLNFGLVPQSVTSAAQTVTLTNTDPTNALTLTSIVVSAPFARPAGAAGGTCSTATAVAVNGGTCTINVVFTPNGQGPFTGSLTVAGNYGGVAATLNPVSLSGSGFSVAPNPLAFNSELVNTASATQVITITNPSNSNAPLSITGISVTGTNANQFALVNSGATDCGTTFPVTLGGGAKGPDGVTPAPTYCTVGVQFRPTSSGNKSGSVTISTYNPAGTSNFNVGLTGTGTTVTISAPNPALTTNPANTTTKTGNVTITNTSGATITFGSATVTKVSGPAASSFSIVAPTSGTACIAGGNIPNGSSCNIGVRYSPGGSTNTSSARVNINYTYNGSPVAQQGTNFNGN